MSANIHDTHAAQARQCNLCCIRDDCVGSMSNPRNARFSHCDKVDAAASGAARTLMRLVTSELQRFMH
jgi:hypothetical protein